MVRADNYQSQQAFRRPQFKKIDMIVKEWYIILRIYLFERE